MSSGGRSSRNRSQSSRGGVSATRSSTSAKQTPPPITLTPESPDAPFAPCAATASFLLYAQRNQILVAHHDTLAIERRFDLHREDVLWIAVDNASERGSGRLAVSYDAGSTAIVWDILSGGEIARFSAYEHIKVAIFMRNGNIAFGNDQGNIILFEPSTSEHISARTIFDPITAIAPSSDNLTFAIGYMNGSILIATLEPSFTILHTLTTTRAPSRITGLSWHGSSSKQKTDMLATQTLEGDLRVWSVPKSPHREPPTIIRVLQRTDFQQPAPCWFAWSKNGRIVQYVDGETRAWDVRTKKVTYLVVPVVEDVVGFANYGPSATLFSLSRNHGVHQYDLNPNGSPVKVASVQHMPANTPPTPPTTLNQRKTSQPSSRGQSSSRGAADASGFPSTSDTGGSSADEAATRSPLQRIAREMESLDAMQDELRDKVMPLSPASSRTSSVSSRSSGGGRRRDRKYLYDRPESSGAASSSGKTEFSVGTPSMKLGRESMSIRSVSSMHSNARFRSSNLRNQIARSPEEINLSSLDLFPRTRARLREVPFRSPHYGNGARTPELLQREMLSVIFGWNDTARSLIRNEAQRQRKGSAAAVLLAKWLGDTGSDQLESMVGSESMSSADWMMLALSSIGADSQKKVGEAFVQRLLEKGDVHPAVAILIGLGENHDAIEVYVSQGCWLEAVLLTCLTCPSDWQRISHLIRQMGAAAVQQGQSELAVRCFSCTSIETSEPWFSPRAQDAAYVAQQEKLTGVSSTGSLPNPPLSPPSRSGSQRLAQKNASLKLITSFGDKGAAIANLNDVLTPTNAVGVTPIAQSAMPFSALSPGGQQQQTWGQSVSRNIRDPTSARTATPGAANRKRLPSRGEVERAKQDTAQMATPITASREIQPVLPSAHSRRTLSLGSNTTADSANVLKPTVYNDRLTPNSALQDGHHLPSPSGDASNRFRANSRGHRSTSRGRKDDGFAVQGATTQPFQGMSQVPNASSSTSLPLSSSDAKHSKNRSIDEYIDSVEEAREAARESRERSKRREESRKREGSRGKRGASRPRELSQTRGLRDIHYIQPAKRSPSSPVSMSPEEVLQASQLPKPQPEPEPATSEDENFYKLASPVDSHKSLTSFRSEPQRVRRRYSPEAPPKIENRTTADLQGNAERRNLPMDRERGRTDHREPGSTARSPSSPLPMPMAGQTSQELDFTNSDGPRTRPRADSHRGDYARTSDSHQDLNRSFNRKPVPSSMPSSHVTKSSVPEGSLTGSELSSTTTDQGQPRTRSQFTKELAAKELEERRLSLARRPSAPSIPLPGQIYARPSITTRASTDNGNNPVSFAGQFSRAQTVDPDQMSRHGRLPGTSTSSTPIGLPATPRAMRHPRYMSTDPNERDAPPVPEIPDAASNLSSVGSSLSQVSNFKTPLTNDDSSSALSSDVSSNMKWREEDGVPPLLPSSVFGRRSTEGPFTRAASAPPEKWQPGAHPAYKPGLPTTRRISNVRKIAPPDSSDDRLSAGPAVTSIDEALASATDQHVVVISEDPEAPPVLPELQHLSGPPPPPPPPKIHTQMQSGLVNTSGVINITIDEHVPTSEGNLPTMLPSTSYSQPIERETTSPMQRAITTSPTAHRRGRASVSESFGSRFRDLSEKMRSNSRNRTKSPADYKPSPYETVLPPVPLQHQRRESESRAKSPYEQAMSANSHNQTRPLPPPVPAQGYPIALPGGKLEETTIPPSSLPRSQSAQGYRNTKDVRANMPPETLQQGVYTDTTEYL